MVCVVVAVLSRPASATHQPEVAARNTGDSVGAELVVRVLDVGQGDAIYIENGASRVIVDGGPDPVAFGRYLDSLGLNNSTIDVVFLSHAHLDHAAGLRELFRSSRNIRVRFFFENKDPSATVTMSRLRDSILVRMDRDGLVYRDTDDPCANGSSLCTIDLAGAAKLHVMRPQPSATKQNDRSVPLKLVAPDSASFTMLLAGDAEKSALRWFERAGYPGNPGLSVNVLKAHHHGSCNGVTARYLALTRPNWLVASLGRNNGYGHMHTQAKAAYRRGKVPWYRTDQNGTVTIRVSGRRGGGFTITPERSGASLDGKTDRSARQC